MKCLKQISEEAIKERESYVKQIKEMKAILRVPRLYNIYNERIEYMKQLRQQYEDQVFHSDQGGYRQKILNDWNGKPLSYETVKQTLDEIDSYKSQVLDGKINIDISTFQLLKDQNENINKAMQFVNKKPS